MKTGWLLFIIRGWLLSSSRTQIHCNVNATHPAVQHLFLRAVCELHPSIVLMIWICACHILMPHPASSLDTPFSFQPHQKLLAPHAESSHRTSVCSVFSGTTNISRKKTRNAILIYCMKINSSRAELLVDCKYWKLNRFSVGKHILTAFRSTFSLLFLNKTLNELLVYLF